LRRSMLLGGNKFCGKTMVVTICIEKNAAVAEALRRSERAG
jgi:hypothetical protein